MAAKHKDSLPSRAAALDRTDALIAACLATAAAVLYGSTVCRTLFWGDSAEFTVVFSRLDIAHPTGYPLLTLLGKLFSLLPFGNVAFRVNLLGTACGIAACVLVYLLSRGLGLGRPAGAFGAALFAVSLQLWDQSTAIEVYALHAGLTAALFLAAFAYSREPSRQRFLGTAALWGLSFTNHLTTLWSGPALAWLFWCGWRTNARPAPWRPGRRDWWLAAAAFTACLTLYLYLPLRSWQGVLFDHGQPSSLGRLLYHVTGRQFQYRMFVSPDAGLYKECTEFASQLSDQFTPWLLPLPAIGLLSLWLRDRRAAVALVLLAGANLAFDLNYHIPDKEGYFLPVYLVAALLAAEGFEALVKLAPWRDRGARAAACALAAALLLPTFANWPRNDKSGDRSLPEFTSALLGSVPSDSLIVADDQFLVWSTAHAQLVEGRFTDRLLVTDYLLCLPWYISHLRRHYPQLVVPATVDELVARRNEEVARAKGWEIGDLSQRYVERIARTIIEANLPRRRVFYNFHDFEERKEWNGLPVLNRGLTYELFEPGRPLPSAEPWAVDYPDPARYRKKELLGIHWRHVAGTFSTSCNRAGIACISAGRYAEAEAAFRRSLAYDDNYAQVYLNLGVLYAQYLPDRGKRDAAWRRFLELAPDDGQAPTVRRELEK